MREPMNITYVVGGAQRGPNRNPRDPKRDVEARVDTQPFGFKDSGAVVENSASVHPTPSCNRQVFAAW